MIVLYMCDPDKNKDCKKHMCFRREPCPKHPCRGTKNPDFAVKDKRGNPIIIYLRFEEPDFADGSVL